MVMMGVSHERAPVEVRERLAVAVPALPAAYESLSSRASESVVLSTCNRTEIYVWTKPGEDGQELLQGFFARRGVDADDLDRCARLLFGGAAVRHLFRVASGLESLVLGEPQILGQIRDALEQSRECGGAGPHVTRLVTDALRIGKRARTETGIARNRTSIAHAGIDLAVQHLGGVLGRRALVVGAGEMARLTAKLLRSQDVHELVIANRSLPAAESLAESVGGRAIPLAMLAPELLTIDVAFGAASTESFLFDQRTLNGQLATRRTPMLAIDLGVPRNIDPALADHAMIDLFDVDDLEAVTRERRSQYAGEITVAEKIVDAGVDAYLGWHAARTVAPTVAAIRKRGEALQAQQVAKTLNKLSHLSERDQNVVRALAASLTGKLLHAPIAHLGSASPELQARDADSAWRLFDLISDDPDSR